MVQLSKGLVRHLVVAVAECMAHDAVEHIASEGLPVVGVERRLPRKPLWHLQLQEEQQDGNDNDADEEHTTTLHASPPLLSSLCDRWLMMSACRCCMCSTRLLSASKPP